MQKVDPSEFTTTREAARLLGVSMRTIQLWVENGVLHAWKTAGGHRRVAKASIDELLKQQRQVIETVTGMNLIKIAVVDDDAVHREFYRMKLQELDLPVTVMTIDDSFEALLAIGESCPDMIITSLNLSRMDGISMVKALCKRAATATIIVVTDMTPSQIDEAGGLPGSVLVMQRSGTVDQIAALLRAEIEARLG